MRVRLRLKQPSAFNSLMYAYIVDDNGEVVARLERPFDLIRWGDKKFLSYRAAFRQACADIESGKDIPTLNRPGN